MYHPFSENFLIGQKPDAATLRNHFQEYLFKRDLFAIESPIQTDRSFFAGKDCLKILLREILKQTSPYGNINLDIRDFSYESARLWDKIIAGPSQSHSW
jgi:hypothetical protein